MTTPPAWEEWVIKTEEVGFDTGAVFTLENIAQSKMIALRFPKTNAYF